MKMRRALVISLLVAASTLLSRPAAGQTLESSLTPKLSLKVIIFEGSAPTYYPLGDKEKSGTGAVIRDFRRLQWRPPLGGEAPVYSVTLGFHREDGRARVRVSVHYDPDSSMDEVKVGEYTVGEGEEYTVAELASYGVEPLRLGLVRRVAVKLSPPHVVNHLRSVEVTAIDIHEEEPSFELKLRNVSEKSIRAVEIRESRGDAFKGNPQQYVGEGKFTVAPGATLRAKLEFGWNHKATPEGHAVEPPDRVTISSVLFTDGSYEGAAGYATRMAAEGLGGKTQLLRALKIMGEWRAIPGLGLRDALTELRSRIGALGYEPEASHLDELTRRYPELSPGELEDMKNSVRAGMKKVRADLLSELKRHIRVARPEMDAEAGARWIDAWLKGRRDLYERVLAQLENVEPPTK